jgi:EAL domain-containing protein (putative c-di-GMP-specific phosphodiesterase class I)
VNGYSAEEIALAVPRDEIVAYFQPQVAVPTGALVAAEALSRWELPSVGVVLPEQYISTAESTGSIVGIDRRMLALACAHAAEWSASGTPLELSVNVSASRLAAGGLEADVLACVSRFGLDPRLLTIELTESQSVAEVADAAGILGTLIAHGIGVSIDDFGTGYADADLLERIPATELKIDRSLIQHPDPSAAAAVAELGREHGLRIVAEGVATGAQWTLARELGCDRAQGFLISEPVPPDRLLELLQATT